MSNILEYMKTVYTKIKQNDFEWKPIYPNNMPGNGISGIYTDMFFEKDNKYQYVKYSIVYQLRIDEKGMGHPEEGTAFYILHELCGDGLDETFEIPEPNNKFVWNDHLAMSVNNYGRFRCVFSDEDTAKSIVTNELIQKIYPYGYLLTEDERQEWNQFVEQFNG